MASGSLGDGSRVRTRLTSGSGAITESGLPRRAPSLARMSGERDTRPASLPSRSLWRSLVHQSDSRLLVCRLRRRNSPSALLEFSAGGAHLALLSVASLLRRSPSSDTFQTCVYLQLCEAVALIGLLSLTSLRGRSSGERRSLVV